jgi:hypothetical protein
MDPKPTTLVARGGRPEDLESWVTGHDRRRARDGPGRASRAAAFGGPVPVAATKVAAGHLDGRTGDGGDA